MLKVQLIKADKDSDIDVAIISQEFGKETLKEKQFIEVHTFSPNEIWKFVQPVK